MGRRQRRRKRLLDDLKEKIGHRKWKEEVQILILWTARFGGGYGLVVKQIADRMLGEIAVTFLAFDLCIRLVT